MRSGAEDGFGWVRAAARNNAELCDMVCRARGVAGSFGTDAWTSATRAPDDYPDAVTLAPSVDVNVLLRSIDASAGASIKDSFAALDLAPFGFRVLFAAEWILRAASVAPVDDATVAWSAVRDAGALGEWEAAWSEDGIARGRFDAALLEVPEMLFLRGIAGGELVAGALVNRSDQVVGISNFFASGIDPIVALGGCASEVARSFPGSAVVGYESGGALEVARRAGFTSIGPLRIWSKE